jgi:hypothetical protein
MKFGTWKVRRLYRAGTITPAARELRRYRLGSVGIQEVRCNKGGNVRTEDYTFSINKQVIRQGQDFSHHIIVS